MFWCFAVTHHLDYLSISWDQSFEHTVCVCIWKERLKVVLWYLEHMDGWMNHCKGNLPNWGLCGFKHDRMYSVDMAWLLDLTDHWILLDLFAQLNYLIIDLLAVAYVVNTVIITETASPIFLWSPISDSLCYYIRKNKVKYEQTVSRNWDIFIFYDP